ncbi:MAG: CpsB/CapC family capsule biosynthesis tyrosine phosphatase, partial [Flavobacteriales bacterium]
MGWFSSLFSKKETNPSSKPLVLSWFGTDIHSHLLPGVDDGAQTMNESIAMVSKMAALGFRQCVLTSHVKMDIYPNESHRLKNAFEQLKNEVEALSIPINLALAAEYYIDDSLLTRLAENDILSFGKERYVLMEFSFATPPVQEQKVFDAFLTAG